MLKKIIMLLIIVGVIVAVIPSEEGPKRRWFSWGWFGRPKNKNNQKDDILDKMNKAWREVNAVLNQQIETLSNEFEGVDPAEVEKKLVDLGELVKDAFVLAGKAITSYSISYTPEKLLHDYAFLQEEDTVIQKARVYAAQARVILDQFDDYLIARLKNIKRKKQQPPRPKAIVDRLQEDWLAETNKIAEMLGKSAARIATRLNIDVPSNKGKDELTALLLTCSDLIKAEQDELQKMVDAFESKWRERLKRDASKDTQEARDQLNHFLTVVKPDLIDNFQQKIVEHWKDKRMHNHPHVRSAVGREELKN